MNNSTMRTSSVMLLLACLTCHGSIMSMYSYKSPINNGNLDYVLKILQQNPFLRLLEVLRSNNSAEFATILSQSNLSSQNIDELFYEAVARNRVEIAQLLMKRHTITIDKWTIKAAQESQDPLSAFAVLEKHPDFPQIITQYQQNQ